MRQYLILMFVMSSSLIGHAQTSKDSLLIDSLNQQAWSFIQKDTKKCLEKAREVRKLAKKRGYPKGEMKSLISCGSAHLLMGSQDSAQYYYSQALEIANKAQIIEGQISVNNNLGALYRSMGLYEISLRHLKRALELKKRENQNGCALINACTNIGNLYVSMEEYDKAIQVFKEGMQYATDDESCFQNLNIGLGVAYYKLDRTKKALSVLKGDFSPALTPIVLNNKGLCYQKEGQYDIALAHFEQALVLNRDSLNSKIGMLSNSLNISKTYTTLGNFLQAERYLDSAWIFIETGKFPEEKIDYFENYSDLYEAKGDFKNAYSCMLKANSLKDSLQTARLDELQSNYFAYFKVEQKQRQLEEEKLHSKSLKLSNERERLKSSRAWWIISLLLIILLIAGTLLYRIIKNRRLIALKNHQLNEEVERRKYFQERYNETFGRSLQASNSQSKREEIDLKRIVLVQKQKGSDSIEIHTLNGSIYTKVKPIIKLIEDELRDSFFSVVNKGTIVNLHYVESINPDEHSITIKLPVLDKDKKKSITETKTIALHKQGEIRERFFSDYDDFVYSGGSK